jgi:peptidylprolyl isomerase
MPGGVVAELRTYVPVTLVPVRLSLRRAVAPVAVLGALSIALAACGSSSSTAAPDSGTKPSSPASSSASSTAKPGPAVFPTVSGSYGTKPTLTFPKQSPSSQLATKVLSEGKGATVTKGELLVVDYLGQIWGGKTFDNSYDRKQPLGTPIGVGQVIPGWDKALVGK